MALTFRTFGIGQSDLQIVASAGRRRHRSVLEFIAPFPGLHQGANQLQTEDGQRDARDYLDQDAVRPKVDVLQ